MSFQAKKPGKSESALKFNTSCMTVLAKKIEAGLLKALSEVDKPQVITVKGSITLSENSVPIPLLNDFAIILKEKK